MRYLSFTLLVVSAFVIAACAEPVAQPAATPGLPSPVPPTSTGRFAACCTPTPPGQKPPPVTPPYAPAPGDEKLQRGNAYVDSAQIIVAESFPPQFFLQLAGSLPTPCNQLRLNPAPPDAQNRIKVEVYSVVDPNAACIEVLEPFEVNVRLGTFPAGKYQVWVNDQPVGDIEAP